ncbi:MAG: hypothetical protein ABIQ90_07320, partial [Polaromonas sp.]
MEIATIGIDLAKNVFQICGVDEHGKKVFKKALKRTQKMAPFFASLSPRMIGVEACGSAHGLTTCQVPPVYIPASRIIQATSCAKLEGRLWARGGSKPAAGYGSCR